MSCDPGSCYVTVDEPLHFSGSQMPHLESEGIASAFTSRSNIQLSCGTCHRRLVAGPSRILKSKDARVPYRKWYTSWPSISLVSVSEDLMNHGSKIFGIKNSKKFQRAKLEFVGPSNYLHSIYIVFTTDYIASAIY